jgi:uncharacterized protein
MSMLLDLTRFRGGVDHVERRFEPEAFGLAAGDQEFRIAAPVLFETDVRKDARKVRLVGRVQSTLEMACSRCLEPFDVPVDSRFDLLFLPASERPEDEDREMSEEDTGVSFYQEDVIDLGEVMREQFYLALPMKPLCREDCAGLCPICGINKNRETCTCEATWVDPRMDALRHLRK